MGWWKLHTPFIWHLTSRGSLTIQWSFANTVFAIDLNKLCRPAELWFSGNGNDYHAPFRGSCKFPLCFQLMSPCILSASITIGYRQHCGSRYKINETACPDISVRRIKRVSPDFLYCFRPILLNQMLRRAMGEKSNLHIFINRKVMPLWQMCGIKNALWSLIIWIYRDSRSVRVTRVSGK